MPKRKSQFTCSLASRYKFLKPGRNQCKVKRPRKTYVSAADKGPQYLETYSQSQHKRNIQGCSGTQDESTAFEHSTRSPAISLAEATLAFHNITHHASYASMDCTPEVHATMYSDSDVARKITCAKTKTEAIVNKVLGPHSIKVAIQSLEEVSCFGVCTDGINHESLHIFPIIIQFFDYKLGGMQTKLLELKSIPNENSETISSYVSDTLRHLGIIEKCVAFGGDNTNTHFGGHQMSEGNNVFTELKKSVSENVVGVSCPAHILHNCMQHGADVLGVDVEVIVMKVYKYLSTYEVRTEELEEYCKFVEINYKELLSTTKTRWLFLFPAIEKLLEVYDVLKSYFLSLPRPPKLLESFFTSKLSKAYLWHLHSLMYTFQDNIKNIQKEGNSIVDVMNIIEDVCCLLMFRLECSFISHNAEEQLSCAREEGFDTAVDVFMEEAIAMYRECYDYLKKWSVSFEDFGCFKWMDLNEKVLTQDVAKCIQFLEEKGHLIDDVKCCDQLYNLNVFLECNNTELTDLSCNDRWVKYFQSSKQVRHSELLKIAEYFFSLPGHNATLARIFMLMSEQWTTEGNLLSVQSIKGLLSVKFNFKNFTCSDFYTYLSGKPGVLKRIAATEKYSWHVDN